MFLSACVVFAPNPCWAAVTRPLCGRITNRGFSRRNLRWEIQGTVYSQFFRWLFFHLSLQRLGLGFFALLAKEEDQVPPESSSGGMLHSKRFLANRERPPKERLGFLILSLIVHEQRQIVQTGVRTRMARSQNLLFDIQRSPI